MYIPENLYNATLFSGMSSLGRVGVNTTFLCQLLLVSYLLLAKRNLNFAVLYEPSKHMMN